MHTLTHTHTHTQSIAHPPLWTRKARTFTPDASSLTFHLILVQRGVHKKWKAVFWHTPNKTKIHTTLAHFGPAHLCSSGGNIMIHEVPTNYKWKLPAINLHILSTSTKINHVTETGRSINFYQQNDCGLDSRSSNLVLCKIYEGTAIKVWAIVYLSRYTTHRRTHFPVPSLFFFLGTSRINMQIN